MLYMEVTLAVLKLRGWLKAAANINIPDIKLTLRVLKRTGWLKALDWLNM